MTAPVALGERVRSGSSRPAELDAHLGFVVGLHVGAVAYLAVQPDQELPSIRATLVGAL